MYDREKNLKAYSLIEVLIALSILSIMCTISMVSFMNFFHRSVDQWVLLALKKTIRFAHHEALISGMSVILCKSDDQKRCQGKWSEGQIVFVDRFGDGLLHRQDQLLLVNQTLKQPGSLYYRAFPYYRDYLLFTANGWLANDNGTFWYCAQEKTTPSWALILAKTARTRVVYPDKKNEIKDARGKALTCGGLIH